MTTDASIRNRRAEFARNQALERFLGELNTDLAVAEQEAMAKYHGQQPALPPIFLVGSARSGSTLFMQWLASTGFFSYPTNLLSRFWLAPIVGARIQKLLTDPDLNFRNELFDLKDKATFQSHHGKTTGALSPNEFWYFWRRFLPSDSYHSRKDLIKTVDAPLLLQELAGVTDVLGKPFATKGLIFSENIPFMADMLPNAVFIWIRRQPEFNVQSLLNARLRQFDDVEQWYSFKIRNYDILRDLAPVESVCGQVASIHQSVEAGFGQLPSSRKLTVDYELLCQKPAGVYREIAKTLAEQDLKMPRYSGPQAFEPRNTWHLDWASKSRVRSIYDHLLSSLPTPDN